MGLYAGAGAGGSVGLGYLALRKVKGVNRKDAGKRLVGLEAPLGGSKARLAALAGSAALAGGSVAAYRHGNSRHNDPWV
jgi:hypothetical protein